MDLDDIEDGGQEDTIGALNALDKREGIEGDHKTRFKGKGAGSQSATRDYIGPTAKANPDPHAQNGPSEGLSNDTIEFNDTPLPDPDRQAEIAPAPSPFAPMKRGAQTALMVALATILEGDYETGKTWLLALSNFALTFAFTYGLTQFLSALFSTTDAQAQAETRLDPGHEPTVKSASQAPWWMRWAYQWGLWAFWIAIISDLNQLSQSLGGGLARGLVAFVIFIGCYWVLRISWAILRYIFEALSSLDNWAQRSLKISLITYVTFKILRHELRGQSDIEALFTVLVISGILYLTIAGIWRLFSLFLKYITAILAGLAGLVTALGGAVSANPHCLEPFPEYPDEAVICLGVSTLESDLDLPPPLSIALFSHSESDPFAFAQNPGRIGERKAAAGPIAFASNIVSINDLQGLASENKEARFNECMHELYEDPAKLMEARAIARYGFDHGVAHDLAMDTLIKVCTQYQGQAIKNLDHYYRGSSLNAMKTFGKKGSRRGRLTPAYAYHRQCLSHTQSGFTESDLALLIEAVDSLDTRYQSVYRFFLQGVSFAQIASRLEISESTARNRFNYAKDKLRDYMQNASCPRYSY